jgi:hypothetical protein
LIDTLVGNLWKRDQQVVITWTADIDLIDQADQRVNAVSANATVALDAKASIPGLKTSLWSAPMPTNQESERLHKQLMRNGSTRTALVAAI